MWFMRFCSACGQELITGTEKFCSSCGQDLKKEEDEVLLEPNRKNSSINIDHAGGDVFGVGVSGSGHIIGKNVVVGSGTINVSQTQLQQLPNEYATALEEFSDEINNQLKGMQIPEEQIESVNNSLEELAKAVQDVKPAKEGNEQEQIDYTKPGNIESKTANVVQKVLNILPEAAETAATFTPLAPFSKLIGKGVDQIVGALTKRKK
jgi:methyl-accepting chemotaxis protein